MKESTLDVLGSQIISNEIAIISLLQALTRAEPAVKDALVQAMRENSQRVPGNFERVRERVEQYVQLLQSHEAVPASESVIAAPALETVRKRA